VRGRKPVVWIYITGFKLEERVDIGDAIDRKDRIDRIDRIG
jgi:hypothetical protein